MARLELPVQSIMCVQDGEYKTDFQKCEEATGFLDISSYSSGTKSRSERLYALLATYLRGRALKILKSENTGCGFRVWRRLSDELQPATRTRALALAQALTRYPPYKEGSSLLEYMLTYERLVGEYERVSPQKYPDDLKISTLLSGLPTDVRRYLQLQISDSTKYEQLRDIMLTFERSSSSWCSEQVLKAIGADSGGPMDVDRVKGKGKKGTKGKSEGKGKAKGFDKGKGKGDHSFKGKSDGKGKKGSGKGKGKSESGKGAKGQKTCWICHKPGHVAADCWRRQQVQEDETSSTVTRSTTAPSTSTTTSAPSSSAKSQVWRVLVYDLTDIGEETGDATEAWPSDQVRRLEEVECEGEEFELPSSSCLWFQLDQDDEEEYCHAVRVTVRIPSTRISP